MTNQTSAVSALNLDFVAVLFAGFLGLAIIAVAGHVQAGTLHHAAHDVRHANGFPCH